MSVLPPPPAGYSLVPATSAPTTVEGVISSNTLPSDQAPPPPAGYTIVPGTPVMKSAPASSGGDSANAPIDDAAKGAGFWTNLRASMAPDVGDQIRRFAAARFPDTPIDQAVQRYGVVNGHIVYADPQGNMVRETPSVAGATGVSDAFTRLGANVAAGTGPAIPNAVGGLAGALAAPETGAVASVPVAGMVSGGVDLARQALDKFAAGEPLNPDYWNAAGQGALAAGGQAAGLVTGKLLSSNPLKVSAYDRIAATDPANIQAAADLEANAAGRGVNLSAGQISGLRSVQALERQQGRFPETADQVFNFTQNQRQNQVPQAIRDEIAQITPVAPGETAVGQFREGSNVVLDNALKARADQATQAYSTALDKPPFWSDDLAPIMNRPSMKQAWGAAQDLAAEKNVTLPQIFTKDADGNLTLNTQVGPDWRSWDYMKRGLDSVIDANTDATTGRMNAMGGAVTGTKQDLLKILDTANPDYAAARLQYGSASDTVNSLLDGGVGLLNTLKNSQPMDRQAIVRRIFDAGNLTPEEVGRMQRNFSAAGQSDAWNAGFGSWLSDKLDASIASAGPTGNLPQKFVGMTWQDPRQKAIIQTALGGDPARAQGIANLMDVLQASAKGLPEGSPTATDLTAMNSDAGKMIGKGARLAGKIVSPETYMNIGTEIVNGLSALQAPEKRIALVNTLLSPGVAGRLKQLALLSPGQQQSLNLTSQILQMAGTSASGMRSPRDFSAPDTSQQGQQ